MTEADTAPEPSPLRARLLSGGLWVLGAKAVTVTVAVLVNALLSRLLTPEDLGLYFLAFSLVNVGALLVQMGQQQAIVRLVAESVAGNRSGRARTAIGAVYRFTLLAIVVFGALILGGGGRFVAEKLFSSPQLASLTALIVIWTSVFALLLLTAEVFRGLQDLRFASIFGGASSGVVTATLLSVLWFTHGTTTLARAFEITIIAVTLSLLVALAVLVRKVAGLGKPEPLGRRELAGLALPIWVGGLTSFVVVQADIWILGAFRPAEELAIYGAAARIVTIVVMPLLLINLVVPPVIAETYSRGEKQRLQRLLRNAATLGGVPAVLVLISMLVAGGPILALVYGEYYRAGAAVLALLSVSKLVVVFTGSCGVTLNMTGHQTTAMRVTLVSGLLTVGLALLLVRPYGLLGVATATCVGTVVQNVWMWLATRLRTGIWTHFGIPRIELIRSLLGSSR